MDTYRNSIPAHPVFSNGYALTGNTADYIAYYDPDIDAVRIIRNPDKYPFQAPKQPLPDDSDTNADPNPD